MKLQFSSDWTYFCWKPTIKKKMHNSFVFRLNLSWFFFLFKIEFDGFLNGIFFFANDRNLGITYSIFKILRSSFISKILGDRVIKPIFEIDIKLVIESISPMIFVCQILHALFKIILQEIFS